MPKNVCFVIAPIGEAGSDIRKRSDQVCRHIIAPAAADHQLALVRADLICEPGHITTQVIQHLMEDAVVVADLTGHNPNVFYELAIRHAFHKPVIQLIHIAERPPFDVAGLRTVLIDHQDFDVAVAARKEISDHIASIFANPDDVDSPVSATANRAALRTGTSLERQFADVLDAIGKLTEVVERLEQRTSVVAPTLAGSTGRLVTPTKTADELDGILKKLQTLGKNSGSTITGTSVG